MSSAGSQFLLLLWKNFKLQSRKKVVTVFEIVIPLFFVAILLLIRVTSDSNYINENTYWNRWMLKDNIQTDGKTKIYFTPDNAFTNAIIDSVIANSNATSSMSFQNFLQVNNNSIKSQNKNFK